MGLFKFFKNLFKPKPLSMPKPKNLDFIQPLSHGFDTIELNQELVVEKDWKAVVVAKGSVQDSFGEGTHKMGLAYLPQTTKALGLDKGKVVKHGITAEVVLPQRFKCDLYFVFVGENKKRFWATEEIKIKSKITKHMHYYLNGSYEFLVQNPEKAVKLFLIDWAKIKTGKAGKKLDSLISEICSEVLWRKKIKNKKPLLEYDFANQVLKPAVNKTMMNYGIVVLNMQMQKLVFPDELSGERFEEVFPEAPQTLPEKVESTNGEVVIDEKNQTEQNDDLQKLEQKNQEIDEKMPKKPRFLKQEVKTLSHEPKNSKKQISQMVKGSLLEIENEGKVKKIPFYSFNKHQKNENYKTADEISNCCNFCGTINFEGSEVCKNCGKKLKGD